MADLILSDELVDRLTQLAAREQRSVEEVVRDMVKQHELRVESNQLNDGNKSSKTDPLLGLVGLLDKYTDETDLSSTVRETIAKYTHPQYGWTKRDRTD